MQSYYRKTSGFVLTVLLAAALQAEVLTTGYEKGTPDETGLGRIENAFGSKTEMSVNSGALTPDGKKVLSCKVVARGVPKPKESWKGENHFASVLYLACPGAMRKGRDYQVSVWVKSSKPTPVLLTVKDKAGLSAAGFKKACSLSSGAGTSWKCLKLPFSAGGDWKAGEFFVQIWFGLLPAGETLEVGPLLLEELPDTRPLDLSAVANMDLRDEVAGDGKGGWSDQGPQNDMRDLTPGRHEFDGIAFDIADPARNGGKAVLTFDGKQCGTKLTEAELAFSFPYPNGRYLYLLHTSCWNGSAKGTAIGTVSFQLADGGTVTRNIRTGIDIADWWNAVGLENGKVVYRKMNGSAAVGLYLTKLEIASSAEKIKRITLKTAGDATWIVVGAAVSSRDLDMALPLNVRFEANREWKVADMSEIRIESGSALDLSAISESGPAGEQGRAVIAPDGSLRFEKAPETPVRLTGFVMGYWGARALFTYTLPGSTPKQDIAAFAEQVKRHGYNVVRMHGLWDEYVMDDAKADGIPDPEKLDMVHYLMSELKKNGVYLYFDIAAYNLGYRKTGKQPGNIAMKAGVMIGDAELRRRWRECAELMKQVNPYTGLAPIDDPAVLCVNFFNEQATGVKIALNEQPDRLPARILDEYKKQWREWNRSAGEVPIPGLYANSPAAANFHRFLTSLSLSTSAWYADVIRNLGYRGLVTQYNSNPDLGCSSVRWQESQIVSTNSYHAHPSNDQREGSRCEQLSSIENLAQTWCYANGWRFQDRPLVASELNHAFWNRYRHEGGLVYPAYAALNGFGGLIWHEGAVDLTVNGKWPRGGGVGVFSIANSPVARANAFLSVCLFQRGDVKAAPHRVELEVTPEYLEANARNTTNSVQRRIGLLTNFSIAFPALKPAPGVGTPKAADIRLRPDVGSQVVDGLWFSTSKEAKDAVFSLDRFVGELKKRGILGPDNISNPAKGIFQSETGEITMRVGEKLMKVVTPRTEAVSLSAGKSERLDALDVKKSSVDALISASSMDGSSLAESSRIVLLYITGEANTGMEVSHDHSQIFKRGGAPVLLLRGTLSAGLRNRHAAGMSLYALGYDGARREKLPLTVAGDTLAIDLDTATLKNGPTPFFELVLESGK